MQHLSTNRRTNALSPDWQRVVKGVLKVTGMTPAQLADRLGVTRQAIYRWTNGETAPRKTQQTALMLLILDTLLDVLPRARVD